MTRLWLINAWRQQYSSQKQLLAGIAEAKLLGFDSYCSGRYGQQWWLCCAPMGAQQQQDIVTALRHQFSHSTQMLVLIQQGQQWLCVSWDHQHLLCALTVHADASGTQQLLFIMQGLWQRPSFNPQCMFSSALPAPLESWLDGVAHQPPQQFSLAQLQPSKQAKLVSLNQLPSWWRRRQLLMTTVALMTVLSVVSWYYWPRPQTPLVTATTEQVAPLSLSGMAVDSLLLLREQLQQLELLAGWQIDQVSLHDHQLQVKLKQGYGRFGELQQQLQQHWQLQQAAQQVQLQRSLPNLPAALQFNQALSQSESQLQQQALAAFPELQWQRGGSGQDRQHQWQDVSLRIDSWYWLELTQLQQLLQGFDVRLLQLQLNRQPQSQIVLQLRLYQPLLTADTTRSMDQGENHDTAMDASIINHQ